LARVPRMSLGHLGRSSGRIRGDTFEGSEWKFGTRLDGKGKRDTGIFTSELPA
jgi:hypothetical protein